MMTEQESAGALPIGDWWGYRTPFRHWRASNVLDTTSYQAVASEFRTFLENATGQEEGRRRLKKASASYDAQILSVDSDIATLLKPFFSQEWVGSLHQLLALPETYRIDAALHSSPPKSRTGWIHTDFCSGWFDESTATDDLTFADRSACDYFTGRPHRESANPREYIRAASMIYYLCNDGWSDGDGGETALYSAAKQRDRTTVGLVPPLNNTLLLFECSPHSYHRFITNPRRRRNSIILWLHMTVDEAKTRWLDAAHRRAYR